jgi:hypothetical protein
MTTMLSAIKLQNCEIKLGYMPIIMLVLFFAIRQYKFENETKDSHKWLTTDTQNF